MSKRIDEKYITGSSVFLMVTLIHVLIVEIIYNAPL